MLMTAEPVANDCGGSEEAAVAMMVGSVLPAAILWWFSGDVILLWLGIVWLKSRRKLSTTPSPDEGLTAEDDRSTSLPVPVSAGGDNR